MEILSNRFYFQVKLCSDTVDKDISPQGFNIITAVLLKVLNNNEAAALKVMIQVVENLLPEHYFNNNLVALSVDLAVFRELLRVHVPRLWAHITKLQVITRY